MLILQAVPYEFNKIRMMQLTKVVDFSLSQANTKQEENQLLSNKP